MANPYLEPPASVVENEQVQTTEILDASTGARLVTGLNTTTVTVDANGARHRVERQVSVRADDGRPIDTKKPTYKCKCGCEQELVPPSAVQFCEFCQYTLAMGHARGWDDGITKAAVCPRCYEPGRRMRAVKRTLRWLVKI
ncbi:MAG: hypothetical protein ACSLFQ_02055 [Thermoanaerobaculia bacterium]